VTNKAYLSKHVIFNEESFLAKDQATSQLPSKINAHGDAPLLFSVPIPIPTILSIAAHTSVAIETPISLAHTKTYVLVLDLVIIEWVGGGGVGSGLT
jgi:hypothetical protein